MNRKDKTRPEQNKTVHNGTEQKGKKPEHNRIKQYITEQSRRKRTEHNKIKQYITEQSRSEKNRA